MPNSRGSFWGLWQWCGLSRDLHKEGQCRTCLSERGSPGLQEKPSWARFSHSVDSASMSFYQEHKTPLWAAQMWQLCVFLLLIPSFKVFRAVSLPSGPASIFGFALSPLTRVSRGPQGSLRCFLSLNSKNIWLGSQPLVPLLGVGIVIEKGMEEVTSCRRELWEGLTVTPRRGLPAWSSLQSFPPTACPAAGSNVF